MLRHLTVPEYRLIRPSPRLLSPAIRHSSPRASLVTSSTRKMSIFHQVRESLVRIRWYCMLIYRFPHRNPTSESETIRLFAGYVNIFYLLGCLCECLPLLKRKSKADSTLQHPRPDWNRRWRPLPFLLQLHTLFWSIIQVLYANAHPSMSHVSAEFIPVFGNCIRMIRWERFLTSHLHPTLIL